MYVQGQASSVDSLRPVKKTAGHRSSSLIVLCRDFMAEHLPCATYALLPTNARETAHAIIALQKHKEWLLNRHRLQL
jgi:hypothetical protein